MQQFPAERFSLRDCFREALGGGGCVVGPGAGGGGGWLPPPLVVSARAAGGGALLLQPGNCSLKRTGLGPG